MLKKVAKGSTEEKAFVELRAILLEFFRICSEKGVKDLYGPELKISSVLDDAVLSKNILTFSLPESINARFGLSLCYSIKLVPGAPTKFYAEVLVPKIAMFSYAVNPGVGISFEECGLIERVVRDKIKSTDGLCGTDVVVNVSKIFEMYNIRIKHSDSRNDDVFSYKDFGVLLKDIKKFI